MKEQYYANEIAFPKLGIDVIIDPTAFKLFGIDVKWYGLIIAIGVALAYLYGIPKFRKNGLDDDKAFNCVIFGLIGALIGARVYYILMTLGKYNWTFVNMLDIRKGGLAIYGGIIGAIIGGFVASRIWKVRLIPVLDVAAPSFLIGQCIGRWGNFVNQEAFGTNTDMPWGMTGGSIISYLRWNSDSIERATGDIVDYKLPVHPCFLYESLWCLLGFLIIHFILRKIRTFDGELILFYAAWYGFGRAGIETFRTDSLMIGDIRVSQAFGLITAAIATLLIVIIMIKRAGKGIPLYKFTEEAKANVLAAEERDRLYIEKKAEKRALKTRQFENELLPDEKLIDDDEETTDSTDEATEDSTDEATDDSTDDSKPIDSADETSDSKSDDTENNTDEDIENKTDEDSDTKTPESED